jgi:hypothetical protein
MGWISRAIDLDLGLGLVSIHWQLLEFLLLLCTP